MEKRERFCTVVEAAFAIGSKDLTRLILARERIGQVIRTYRSNLSTRAAVYPAHRMNTSQVTSYVLAPLRVSDTSR